MCSYVSMVCGACWGLGDEQDLLCCDCEMFENIIQVSITHYWASTDEN